MTEIMSHTVRVFKLMYIVAGILVSNEAICDTVDRIQIAPRLVDAKPDMEVPKSRLQQQQQQQQQQATTTRRKSRRSWLSKLNVFLIVRTWRQLLRSLLSEFNIWTIPNYVLVHSSSFISKRLFLNSDCDLIYK